MNKKKYSSFYIRLLGLSVISFAIHILILKLLGKSLFANRIIASYLINTFTAILIYFIIDNFKHKFKDNIGFIFMMSSFLKFVLYFVFIQPYISNNGIITKFAFFTFYIPYTICLIFETYSLVKLLNNLDAKK